MKFSLSEIKPVKQSKVLAALTPYYDQRKKCLYRSRPSQQKSYWITITYALASNYSEIFFKKKKKYLGTYSR